MTIIYDVILVQHRPSPSNPNICVFYDEDRNKALKAMRDYEKRNGFTYEKGKLRFTIATLVLRERESTGKVISETKYHELFDINGKLLDTKKGEKK